MSLVAGVLALPMIFCGALSVSKNSTSVGMSALWRYSLVYSRNRCHRTVDEFAALDHGRGHSSRNLVCLPQ